MALELEQVHEPTADVRLLIEELDADLHASYAPEQQHGLNLASIFRPNILFFIARLDGQPVGCCGIALENGFAEVKRMYVRPAARGRDVARQLLKRVEKAARQHGVRRLLLETGDVQHAAIRFYEREGFVPCTAFGGYAVMPRSAIERSLFFEKTID